MKKLLFASDIDNTLMFSYRYRIDSDLCIERLDGKEQGFLSAGTPMLLERVNAACLFVPVTTRSVAQYKRIQWPEGCDAKYAVAANGGILLVDGEADEAWLKDSREMIAPWRSEMERMLSVLEASEMCRVQSIIDEMFLFAACNNAEEAQLLKAHFEDETTLTVELTGRKVYFFPEPLHKGAALQRLQKRFCPDRTFSAGDSPIDVPMLSAADVAAAPARLDVSACENKILVHSGSERFAEFILENVLREIEEI